MLDLALFRSSSFSYPGREWGLQRRVGGGGRGSAAQEATGGTYQPAIDLDLADLVHVCDVDGISPPTGGTTMYRFEKVFFISWQGSAPASPSLQRPQFFSPPCARVNEQCHGAHVCYRVLLLVLRGIEPGAYHAHVLAREKARAASIVCATLLWPSNL